MKESFIAKVYAQSLFELGKEQNIAIADELTSLITSIREVDALENALFLEVFTIEEKHNVFTDVAKKMSLSDVVTKTGQYLINEKRMNILPLIYKELILLDDEEKGFLRSTVEGHKDSLDDSLKDKIKTFLKTKTGKDPIIEYKQNTNITAGYKVTADDLQLDASIDSMLDQFKREVLN